jgi:hypothetical protein
MIAERIRAAILLLTTLAIVHHLATPPPAPFVRYIDTLAPLGDRQVKYCVISYRAIVKRQHFDRKGNLVEKQGVEWTKGFGPCELQDIYRDI